MGLPRLTGRTILPVRDEHVEVASGTARLGGRLAVLEEPAGVVMFAHGSGSSRHSPRNRYVASVLRAAGLATLLFNLLTADEEAERASVFDIELLTERLLDVTRWLRTAPDLAGLPVGYFGASTGAAPTPCRRTRGRTGARTRSW